MGRCVWGQLVGWGSFRNGELYEWSEIPECSWFFKNCFLTVFVFKSRDVVKVPCIWLYVRLISSGTMALTPGCADGGWQTAVALKGVFAARWTCLWNFLCFSSAACHYFPYLSLQVLSGLISLIVNRSLPTILLIWSCLHVSGERLSLVLQNVILECSRAVKSI